MDTVNQVINDIVKYRHAFFVDDMIALLVHCFRYGQINVIENSFAWKHVWPLRHHVSDSDSIEIRQKIFRDERLYLAANHDTCT